MLDVRFAELFQPQTLDSFQQPNDAGLKSWRQSQNLGICFTVGFHLP